MNEVKNNRELLYEKIKFTHGKSLYKKRELPHLIAVSKQQKLEKITQALDAGHRIFGENRVQEAEQKWISLL